MWSNYAESGNETVVLWKFADGVSLMNFIGTVCWWLCVVSSTMSRGRTRSWKSGSTKNILSELNFKRILSSCRWIFNSDRFQLIFIRISEYLIIEPNLYDEIRIESFRCAFLPSAVRNELSIERIKCYTSNGGNSNFFTKALVHCV